MGDYLAAQQTIESTFDSDFEAITPELEKIQFAGSGEGLLRRPDKLRAHRVGGYSDVEMIFDGERIGIHDRAGSACARIDAKGTVDQPVGSLRAGRGVATPVRHSLMRSVHCGAPAEAAILDPDDLIHLDELPPPAEEGEGTIAMEALNLKRLSAGAIAGLAIALTAAHPQAAAQEWRGGVTAYGWVPAIDMQVDADSGAGTSLRTSSTR